MPIFEYTCESCNYTFDQLVMRQETKVNCPLCQGEVKKLMSTFAVGPSESGGSTIPSTAKRPMCATC